MKNNIPKDTDVFKLLPDITEKETIQFLSEVAALAYKKDSSRWKYTKAAFAVYLCLNFAMCLKSVYHREYLLLVFIILSTALITCIYKIVADNIKLSKLTYLFIDNKETEINSYDTADNGFIVNFKDKTTQRLQNVQSAFLVSDYIMLVFKDNSIAIIKPDKQDREKILYEIHSVDSRITSYDRTPQNMLWMKKYYKKLFIKFMIPVLIFALLYIFMSLII